MRGVKGLIALSLGLAVGAAAWLGVVHLVRAVPKPERAAVAAAPAGSTGATAPAGEEEEAAQSLLIVQGTPELVSLLANAPFVHRGAAGPMLYVVTFRSCPGCAEFKDKEWAGLDAAGVDVRWIIYARRDRDGASRSLQAERALVADLALTRSYSELEAWFKAPTPGAYYDAAQLPPAAESAPERVAALEASRTLIDNLNDVTARNGAELAIPAFFWQQADGWHVMIGYDQPSFANVKQALSILTGPPSEGVRVDVLPAPQQ